MQQATTGTSAQSVVLFKTASGTIMDPTVVRCEYWKETTTPTVETFTAESGPITKTGTGEYSITITTTGAGDAVWTVNWIGIGAVAAVRGIRFRTVARAASAG